MCVTTLTNQPSIDLIHCVHCPANRSSSHEASARQQVINYTRDAKHQPFVGQRNAPPDIPNSQFDRAETANQSRGAQFQLRPQCQHAPCLNYSTTGRVCNDYPDLEVRHLEAPTLSIRQYSHDYAKHRTVAIGEFIGIIMHSEAAGKLPSDASMCCVFASNRLK